jgi:hypothetical protein
VLAACGSPPKSVAEAAADCLNARGFLVEARGDEVSGGSPRGVNFTSTVTAGTTRIDDSGNPGTPPRRLAPAERAAIEACAKPR